jgi:amylosucrase
MITKSYAFREENQLISNSPEWIHSANTIGMMLYVDLFNNDIDGLVSKTEYFKNLGITLIHLMPLVQPRNGENDGGYAVRDYREVNPKLGNVESLKNAIKNFHDNGIRICIDYVINHTSDDHEWAIKAKSGDKKYQDYYFMYDDYTIPRQYEATMNQVFPKVAPGNFTYIKEIDKWVMTTFYDFQWDLNYRNPKVLEEMTSILLYYANLGVDMIRLDAIPYIWKTIGTSCRNLPEVHIILKIFRSILSQYSPSTVLLGESIVAPEIITRYFGSENSLECDLLYNASYMVEIWNSLATRDARHISNMPIVNNNLPTEWINYARCHDDIGWGLNEDNLRRLGFDPFMHKQFLIDFYLGSYKDSFSIGELYEYDPVTKDARNCGTLASLAGLEKALLEKDNYKLELALKRINLINSLIVLRKGIPMIYSGDEIGLLNNYEYKNDPDKKHDSRWIHRQKFNWEKSYNTEKCDSYERVIFNNLIKLINIRKEINLNSSIKYEKAIEVDNKHILVIQQFKENDDNLLLIFNFSEDRQFLSTSQLIRHGINAHMVELLQGKELNLTDDFVQIGPYEFLILKNK